MKLNLCCGPKHIEGFTNVDFVPPADVVHDLNKPLPFESGSVEKIVCFHGLEHFYRFQADDILADWVRVLKPGGKLVVEVPCLDKILALFAHYIKHRKPIDDRLTLWGLYGDPNYRSEAMTHRWCYAKTELVSMFSAAGLTDVQEMEPKTHIAIRDMRVEGVKP